MAWWILVKHRIARSYFRTTSNPLWVRLINIFPIFSILPIPPIFPMLFVLPQLPLLRSHFHYSPRSRPFFPSPLPALFPACVWNDEIKVLRTCVVAPITAAILMSLLSCSYECSWPFRFCVNSWSVDPTITLRHWCLTFYRYFHSHSQIFTFSILNPFSAYHPHFSMCDRVSSSILYSLRFFNRSQWPDGSSSK